LPTPCICLRLVFAYALYLTKKASPPLIAEAWARTVEPLLAVSFEGEKPLIGSPSNSTLLKSTVLNLVSLLLVAG